MTDVEYKIKIAQILPCFDYIETSDLELLSAEELDEMTKEAVKTNKPSGNAHMIDIVRLIVGMSLKDVILLRHQERDNDGRI